MRATSVASFRTCHCTFASIGSFISCLALTIASTCTAVTFLISFLCYEFINFCCTVFLIIKQSGYLPKGAVKSYFGRNPGGYHGYYLLFLGATTFNQSVMDDHMLRYLVYCFHKNYVKFNTSINKINFHHPSQSITECQMDRSQLSNTFNQQFAYVAYYVTRTAYVLVQLIQSLSKFVCGINKTWIYYVVF